MYASLLVAAVAAFAQQPAVVAVQEKCKIEGRVLNLNTGEPLKKATLRLRGTVQAAGAASTPSSYTSVSDAEGKFLFEDVDPGTYVLSADRAGFVAQNYGARQSGMGGPPLKLDAGQHLKDLIFKLTPQGMIYGKVTDEDGDTVPDVFVQVLYSSYSRGKKQLQFRGGSQVQADGTFVIGSLAAGRYYLSATDDRGNYNDSAERPGRKGPEEGYVTTYFPNAIDAAAAAPIEIAAGAELRGIEIRLRKARVFRIRGKVVNTLTGALPQNMMLMLTAKDGNDLMLNRRNTRILGNSGSFEFANVLPGTYVIRTNRGIAPPDGARPALVGRAIVNLGDDNVDNVVVLLGSGVDVTGSVKMEGGASNQTDPQKPPVRPNIRLNLVEGGAPNPLGTQSKEDGTFELHGIAPEVYRISIIPLPDGSYIKSIQFGGQDVTKGPLDLTTGAGGKLEILLSPNAADVSGVVRNSKGEAVQGVMVQIWLPGDDAAKNANTDQNGNFKIGGLAPGEYRIVAWDDLEPGLAQDSSFRARFETQATTVKLRDNSHETVEVKLIAKGAIEAEAAKVR